MYEKVASGYQAVAKYTDLAFVLNIRLENPCYKEGGQCIRTYGFRHHLPLSINSEKFIVSGA